MTPDVAFQSPSATHHRAGVYAPDLELPDCPCCGVPLLMPEGAEFAGEGRIRHTWICEGCGHTFQTAVQLRQSFQPVPD